MIRTQNQVPRYYTRESRDFQLLCHLFDSMFNVSKTAIDAFDPETRVNYDSKFVDLACRTIGFFNKGQYDVSIMRSLIKSFKHLVKNKGKLSSVEESIKLLLRAQGISNDYLINNYNNTLEIYLPTQTQSTALLEELFNYILPVGYTYTIYLQDINKSNNNVNVYLTPDNDYTKVVTWRKEEASYPNFDLVGSNILDMKTATQNIPVFDESRSKTYTQEEVLNIEDKDANGNEVKQATPQVNRSTVSYHITIPEDK